MEGEIESERMLNNSNTKLRDKEVDDESIILDYNDIKKNSEIPISINFNYEPRGEQIETIQNTTPHELNGFTNNKIISCLGKEAEKNDKISQMEVDDCLSRDAMDVSPFGKEEMDVDLEEPDVEMTEKELEKEINSLECHESKPEKHVESSVEIELIVKDVLTDIISIVVGESVSNSCQTLNDAGSGEVGVQKLTSMMVVELERPPCLIEVDVLDAVKLLSGSVKKDVEISREDEENTERPPTKVEVERSAKEENNPLLEEENVSDREIFVTANDEIKSVEYSKAAIEIRREGGDRDEKLKEVQLDANSDDMKEETLVSCLTKEVLKMIGTEPKEEGCLEVKTDEGDGKPALDTGISCIEGGSNLEKREEAVECVVQDENMTTENFGKTLQEKEDEVEKGLGTVKEVSGCIKNDLVGNTEVAEMGGDGGDVGRLVQPLQESLELLESVDLLLRKGEEVPSEDIPNESIEVKLLDELVAKVKGETVEGSEESNKVLLEEKPAGAEETCKDLPGEKSMGEEGVGESVLTEVERKDSSGVEEVPKSKCSEKSTVDCIEVSEAEQRTCEELTKLEESHGQTVEEGSGEDKCDVVGNVLAETAEERKDLLSSFEVQKDKSEKSDDKELQKQSATNAEEPMDVDERSMEEQTTLMEEAMEVDLEENAQDEEMKDVETSNELEISEKEELDLLKDNERSSKTEPVNVEAGGDVAEAGAADAAEAGAADAAEAGAADAAEAGAADAAEAGAADAAEAGAADAAVLDLLQDSVEAERDLSEIQAPKITEKCSVEVTPPAEVEAEKDLNDVQVADVEEKLHLTKTSSNKFALKSDLTETLAKISAAEVESKLPTETPVSETEAKNISPAKSTSVIEEEICLRKTPATEIKENGSKILEIFAAAIDEKSIVSETSAAEVEEKNIVSGKSAAEVEEKSIVSGTSAAEVEEKRSSEKSAAEVEEKSIVSGTSAAAVEEKSIVSGTSAAAVEEKSIVSGTPAAEVEEKSIVSGTSAAEVEEKSIVSGTSAPKPECLSSDMPATEIKDKSVLQETFETKTNILDIHAHKMEETIILLDTTPSVELEEKNSLIQVTPANAIKQNENSTTTSEIVGKTNLPDPTTSLGERTDLTETPAADVVTITPEAKSNLTETPAAEVVTIAEAKDIPIESPAAEVVTIAEAKDIPIESPAAEVVTIAEAKTDSTETPAAEVVTTTQEAKSNLTETPGAEVVTISEAKDIPIESPAAEVVTISEAKDIPIESPAAEVVTIAEAKDIPIESPAAEVVTIAEAKNIPIQSPAAEAKDIPIESPAAEVVTIAEAKNIPIESPAAEVVTIAEAKNIPIESPAAEVVTIAEAKNIPIESPAAEVVTIAEAKDIPTETPASEVVTIADAKSIPTETPAADVVTIADAKSIPTETLGAEVVTIADAKSIPTESPPAEVVTIADAKSIPTETPAAEVVTISEGNSDLTLTAAAEAKSVPTESPAAEVVKIAEAKDIPIESPAAEVVTIAEAKDIPIESPAAEVVTIAEAKDIPIESPAAEVVTIAEAKNIPIESPAAEVVTIAEAKNIPIDSPAAEVVTIAEAKNIPTETPAAEVVTIAEAKNIPIESPAAEVVTIAEAKNIPIESPAAEVVTIAEAKNIPTETPAAEVVTIAKAKNIPIESPAAEVETITEAKSIPSVLLAAEVVAIAEAESCSTKSASTEDVTTTEKQSNSVEIPETEPEIEINSESQCDSAVSKIVTETHWMEVLPGEISEARSDSMEIAAVEVEYVTVAQKDDNGEKRSSEETPTAQTEPVETKLRGEVQGNSPQIVPVLDLDKLVMEDKSGSMEIAEIEQMVDLLKLDIEVGMGGRGSSCAEVKVVEEETAKVTDVSSAKGSVEYELERLDNVLRAAEENNVNELAAELLGESSKLGVRLADNSENSLAIVQNDVNEHRAEREMKEKVVTDELADLDKILKAAEESRVFEGETKESKTDLNVTDTQMCEEVVENQESNEITMEEGSSTGKGSDSVEERLVQVEDNAGSSKQEIVDSETAKKIEETLEEELLKESGKPEDDFELNDEIEDWLLGNEEGSMPEKESKTGENLEVEDGKIIADVITEVCSENLTDTSGENVGKKSENQKAGENLDSVSLGEYKEKPADDVSALSDVRVKPIDCVIEAVEGSQEFDEAKLTSSEICAPEAVKETQKESLSNDQEAQECDVAKTLGVVVEGDNVGVEEGRISSAQEEEVKKNEEQPSVEKEAHDNLGACPNNLTALNKFEETMETSENERVEGSMSTEISEKMLATNIPSDSQVEKITEKETADEITNYEVTNEENSNEVMSEVSSTVVSESMESGIKQVGEASMATPTTALESQIEPDETLLHDDLDLVVREVVESLVDEVVDGPALSVAKSILKDILEQSVSDDSELVGGLGTVLEATTIAANDFDNMGSTDDDFDDPDSTLPDEGCHGSPAERTCDGEEAVNDSFVSSTSQRPRRTAIRSIKQEKLDFSVTVKEELMDEYLAFDEEPMDVKPVLPPPEVVKRMGGKKRGRSVKKKQPAAKRKRRTPMFEIKKTAEPKPKPKPSASPKKKAVAKSPLKKVVPPPPKKKEPVRKVAPPPAKPHPPPPIKRAPIPVKKPLRSLTIRTTPESLKKKAEESVSPVRRSMFSASQRVPLAKKRPTRSSLSVTTSIKREHSPEYVPVTRQRASLPVTSTSSSLTPRFQHPVVKKQKFQHPKDESDDVVDKLINIFRQRTSEVTVVKKRNVAVKSTTPRPPVKSTTPRPPVKDTTPRPPVKDTKPPVPTKIRNIAVKRGKPYFKPRTTRQAPEPEPDPEPEPELAPIYGVFVDTNFGNMDMFINENEDEPEPEYSKPSTSRSRSQWSISRYGSTPYEDFMRWTPERNQVPKPAPIVRKCQVVIKRMPFIDRLLPTRKAPAKIEPNICELCEPKRMFLSKAGLAEHINMEHIGKKQSSGTTDSPSDLTICITENTDTCLGCRKKFHSKNRLVQHIKTCKDVLDLPPNNERIEKRVDKIPGIDLSSLGKNITITKTSSEDKLEKNQGDATRKHICRVCNKSFLMAAALVAHSKIHQGTPKLPIIKTGKTKSSLVCDVCSKTFGNCSDLVDHMSSHSLPSDREKDLILTNLNKISNIQITVKKKEPPKPEYDSDNDSFDGFIEDLSDLNEIYKGKSNKRPVKPLQCAECGRLFTIKSVYERHMSLVKKIEFLADQTKCPVCDVEIKFRCELGAHLDSHKPKVNKELICKKCDKTFRSENNLIRHELEHEGKLKVVCQHCGDVYKLNELYPHMERCEFKVSEHKCTVCAKVFSAKWRLDLHMKTDEKHYSKGQQPPTYFCDQCGRQFKHLNVLNRHVESKCGTEPMFECQECKKKYFSPGSLAAHKQTHHSTEKNFICQYCSKDFFTKNQLNRHELRHNPDSRPHRCKFPGCDKSYRQPDSLRAHECEHTGVYPYACEFCGLQFSNVKSLKLHRKTSNHWSEVEPNKVVTQASRQRTQAKGSGDEMDSDKPKNLVMNESHFDSSFERVPQYPSLQPFTVSHLMQSNPQPPVLVQPPHPLASYTQAIENYFVMAAQHHEPMTGAHHHPMMN